MAEPNDDGPEGQSPQGNGPIPIPEAVRDALGVEGNPDVDLGEVTEAVAEEMNDRVKAVILGALPLGIDQLDEAAERDLPSPGEQVDYDPTTKDLTSYGDGSAEGFAPNAVLDVPGVVPLIALGLDLGRGGVVTTTMAAFPNRSILQPLRKMDDRPGVYAESVVLTDMSDPGDALAAALTHGLGPSANQAGGLVRTALRRARRAAEFGVNLGELYGTDSVNAGRVRPGAVAVCGPGGSAKTPFMHGIRERHQAQYVEWGERGRGAPADPLALLRDVHYAAERALNGSASRHILVDSLLGLAATGDNPGEGGVPRTIISALSSFQSYGEHLGLQFTIVFNLNVAGGKGYAAYRTLCSFASGAARGYIFMVANLDGLPPPSSQPSDTVFEQAATGNFLHHRDLVPRGNTTRFYETRTYPAVGAFSAPGLSRGARFLQLPVFFEDAEASDSSEAAMVADPRLNIRSGRYGGRG